MIDSDFALYPEEIDGLEGKFNNDATKSYLITVFRDKESINDMKSVWINKGSLFDRPGMLLSV